jgi:hypothetical protein
MSKEKSIGNRQAPDGALHRQERLNDHHPSPCRRDDRVSLKPSDAVQSDNQGGDRLGSRPAVSNCNKSSPNGIGQLQR